MSFIKSDLQDPKSETVYPAADKKFIPEFGNSLHDRRTLIA
jgi:hypothetical protein